MLSVAVPRDGAKPSAVIVSPNTILRFCAGTDSGLRRSTTARLGVALGVLGKYWIARLSYGAVATDNYNRCFDNAYDEMRC